MQLGHNDNGPEDPRKQHISRCARGVQGVHASMSCGVPITKTRARASGGITGEVATLQLLVDDKIHGNDERRMVHPCVCYFSST